ncbi:MAG: PAS domain-containing sensor histidine kinase [Chryseobacterium sp.]|nr:PAS domain-containing sensor histidine kinase [Chryseobacterium sp.]
MKNFIKSNISQDSLALLLTQAPIALSMLMGDDFVIKVANPQMLELWGKQPEIIGLRLIDALPEIKDQPFLDILTKVKKTGNPYKGYKHLAFIERNGQTKECYFDFIYAPIYNDEESEIIGVSVVATETTEQVLTERKVEETEYKFKNLIKESDYAIAIYKGENFIIDLANDKMLKSWGKDSSIIGKRIEEGIPELVGQAFLGLLKNVYESGKTYSAKEDRADLVVDGKLQTFYYNFSYQPLKNHNGEVYAIANVAVDVTDVVLAKKELQKNQEKYRNLADSLPIIIWTADKNGKIDYYNKKWYDYTGFEGIDTREKAAHKILHPDDTVRAINLWEVSKKNKSGYEIEYQFKNYRKENSYEWFLGRAVPIKDQNDEIIQWIGTCTDINEFKQFQQQKDNFLGIASHELKTPLTSLKLYSQFLEKNLRKQNDDKNADVARKMDDQINKLTGLVNDLLDVTKIQNGKILLNKSDFNFDDLVKEIIEEEQMNTNHKIHLEAENVGNVFGDRHRISQVMSNLISNAIKYSPNADKIQITKKLTDKNQVLFCVKDYGIGIPQDKQDRVFEQYYRVSGSMEHTFPGLGLGLYISSEIIKRSGGRIFVNSVEDKGSDFCFEIPKTDNP